MDELSPKKLKSIYFSGFKNLADCSLPLDDITVLVGPNNSGKSNFLELFQILSDLHFAGKNGKEGIINRIQGVDGPIEIRLEGQIGEEPESYDITYQIVIRIENVNDITKLIIDSESFSYKLKSSPGKPKQLFRRTGNELFWKRNSTHFKKFEISGDEPALSVIRSSLENESGDLIDLELYVLFIEYFTPVIFSVHNFRFNYRFQINKILKVLFNLQKKNDVNFSKFRSRFSDILNLNRFEIHNLTSKIKDIDEEIFTCRVVEKFREKSTSLESMSDGSKILFLMLYQIFIRKGPLICIEEPEIGLHPQALNKVLSIFLNKETESQVIITTHSAYLVNLLHPKNVFLMEGNENKKSTIVPVSKITDLEKRLKSKYVNFGDLLVENFNVGNSTDLTE